MLWQAHSPQGLRVAQSRFHCVVFAVSRIKARSDLYEMDLTLDINVDVFPGVGAAERGWAHGLFLLECSAPYTAAVSTGGPSRGVAAT